MKTSPDHEPTDWDLVERVKAGDDAAFQMLMQRYTRPLLNFIYRLIGNAAEAEDVTQDLFARAYQHIRKPPFHRTSASFSTWLFQVARNAALDSLRRRKRHPAESLSVLEERGISVPGGGSTAAEALAVKETGEQIAAAVALLPEDQRTVLLLSEYEQLPDSEIANILKCSQKSVEARLYRARQFLRRRLAHLIE